MSSIESTKWETNLISEFFEYQRLYEDFVAIKSKKVKAVVRFFEMRSTAKCINKIVDSIIDLHKKLPEQLQSKHDGIIRKVSEGSKEINDVINAGMQKSLTKNTIANYGQPQLLSSPKISSPKTRKFVRQATPKKIGNMGQLTIVKRSASPLNSPKRRNGKYSILNLKSSASALFKFKLSSELIKYHQLYDDFIAIEGSKIKTVVRRYEMHRIAQSLHKKYKEIMNIRKQVPEQDQSKNDAIIKHILDKHARIKTIIKSEQEKSSDQKWSTPKHKTSKFGFFNKRRDNKRDSTPRKTPKDLKSKTPKKMKSAFAFARKLSTEFCSDNLIETEERKESKLHDWYSSAVLKLKRKGTKYESH